MHGAGAKGIVPQRSADMLLQPVVEGEAGYPPAEPAAGATYIVAAPASGPFEGRENSLASWQQEQWIFATPVEGMRVFDRNASVDRRYDNGWSVASPIASPNGGASIDTEARAAISAIIECLRQSGNLPPA
ncbi:DUF2793 domain-containing protein [Croceicoccus sp. Ery5]|uniref:DUF2793 domain-containing protein n=1 Tax=Croceicoccus sp. Ery5 TaxID=1703340 RepID=UPI001E4EA9C6|nr:DUF2793 domain-containing protein [Croceicoccus sp. Ery5]